eukprot:TRINITY_DN655_c0_g1_i6.p1 TRINITY_DN655_c0_g1~~TRINITY_DN655_c0_g1_i6.p1  ORF type:complete len:333 (+),score=93.67 TRINITY_DN655_c0_g1_i6:225-1223(+)
MQTAVELSDDLKAAWADAKTARTRFLKVVANHETAKLELAASGKMAGLVGPDFDKLAEALGDKEPCFVLLRMDNGGHEWAFVSYIPDAADVKEKMSFASAELACRESLGRSQFTVEYKASHKSEMTYFKLQQHTAKDQAAPLSASELTRAEADRQESTARMEMIAQLEQRKQQQSGTPLPAASSAAAGPGVSKRGGVTSGFHAVAFPLSEKAKEALASFGSGTVSFLKLTVDDVNSTIELEEAAVVSLAELAGHVSATAAFFYLLHHANKNCAASVAFCDCFCFISILFSRSALAVFVYVCPESAVIRTRMLFSTTQKPLQEAIAQTVPMVY